jgi:hypothetical protein
MIRSVVALCALFKVAMCVAIGWRVTVVPENHWGVDQRWLIPLFALQLVGCVLPRVPLTSAARGLLAVTSALGSRSSCWSPSRPRSCPTSSGSSAVCLPSGRPALVADRRQSQADRRVHPAPLFSRMHDATPAALRALRTTW